MTLRTLALTAPLLASLASAPAAAATRDWPVRGFERIDLAAAATVDVHTGAGFSVHASGDPRLVDKLLADVRDGTLVIRWQPGFHASDVRRNDLRVAVTLPRLSGAAVSGAGTVTVDRVEGPDFAATVGGAGSLKLAAVHTGHAALNVGGAGHIAAAGQAGRIDAHVSGVGAIDAAALGGRAGTLDLSGTGSIKARIDGPVMVSMSGIGSVTVSGHPQCTVRKSGLGSVRCDS